MPLSASTTTSASTSALARALAASLLLEHLAELDPSGYIGEDGYGALVSAMARRGTSTDEGHNENYTKDNLFRIKVVPALDASFTQTLQLATDFSAAIATSVAGTEEAGDWRLPDEVRWLVGKVASQTLQLHALEDEIATLVDKFERDLASTSNPSAIIDAADALLATRASKRSLLMSQTSTLLLKLSLVPPRMTESLLTSHPDLLAALKSYDAALERRLARGRKEGAGLEEKLARYESVLRAGNGKGRRGGGEYGELLNEMDEIARGRKEVERDLKRMGWTGNRCIENDR